MSVAIKVEGLSKVYHLGEIGTGTISRDIERWWALLRGKEDPFLRIGETNDRTSKGRSNVVYSLRDVNLEIKEGEAVGVIGRNGAGKSTLLKILSRVTSPTAGSISVRGRVASLLEVGTGFHPELTGRENIYLNGAIQGMRKKEITRKLDEIVDFSGIGRYIDTPVKRYSSGMYVRLAFAVAAHLECEIMIVDEVLAVGDAEFQKKCLGKMGEVSKGQGRTVLFVSHNMGVIKQLCSSSVFLSKGHVEYSGKTDEAIGYYLFDKEAKNYYEIETYPNKPVYFKKIEVLKENNSISSNFSFDEKIRLKFSFIAEGASLNAQIGIALQDKYNTRVFTVLKELDFFTKNSDGVYEGHVTLPDSIIAPNNYSFVFALWNKNGMVYDALEGVCPITIFDSGTELASYEGVDYGNIIINPTWENA